MTSFPILPLGYNRPEFPADRIRGLRKIALPLIFTLVDGSNDFIEAQINLQPSLNPQEWPNKLSITTWRYMENLGLTHHATSAIDRVLLENLNAIVVEDYISL